MADCFEPDCPCQLSRSPITGLAQSPIAGLSRSPITGLSQSPITGLARSPIAGLAQSPIAGLARPRFKAQTHDSQAQHPGQAPKFKSPAPSPVSGFSTTPYVTRLFPLGTMSVFLPPFRFRPLHTTRYNTLSPGTDSPLFFQ
ncbi:hypothetical protein KL86DES1_20149 [uncultured Desulfovibrio sp.]|uniref:Uncharacterized protein n=1 Tax=uncultured Desulfovibrio sp. TaxID=167968 RepID=A0A212L2D0_9BACT|nr:hypothetical protein KL86DES1_20149 [uncultured Desulfovibrio sp.]VZH33048.1 conserved protein of unknown function [Desulfovibrio sp. 86]